MTTTTAGGPSVAEMAPPRSRLLSEWKERLIHAALFGCGAISILTTLGIVLVLLVESIPFFDPAKSRTHS